jgi:hypothetical protein
VGEYAGQQLDRRRFAGAVRAQIADDLAFADLETDVVDGPNRLVLRRKEPLHLAAQTPSGLRHAKVLGEM